MINDLGHVCVNDKENNSISNTTNRKKLMKIHFYTVVLFEASSSCYFRLFHWLFYVIVSTPFYFLDLKTLLYIIIYGQL